MHELIQQGVQLMVLGMGVVFLFLGLLIGVITLTSKIIQHFETIETAPAEHSNSANASNHDLIEVITEAVQQYRSNHPRRKK